MPGEQWRGRVTAAARSRRAVLRTLGVAAIGSSVASGTGATLQPDFRVEITDAPDQMVAGESATVTAKITNRTGRRRSATVSVNFPGESKQVALAGNESTTVTLGFSTSSDDAGNQLLEVTCANAADGVRVDVLEPAFYEVEIVGTNAPVVEGERLDFTVEITNTGEASGNQRIRYEVEEQGPFGELLGEGGTSVSLNGGSSTTVSFSVRTLERGNKTVIVTVASDDAPTSETVQVREARDPTFEVSITDAASVTQGETFEATVEVENTGDFEGTKTVELELGDVGSASREVTIGARESTTETFSIPTERGSAGTHTLTARTADDTDSRTVEIGATPFFEVSVVGHNAPVRTGETLEVTVTVENTGGAGGEDSVSIDAGEVGSGSIDVSLGSGETTTDTVRLSTGSVEPGTYTVAVQSSHDSASTEVRIEPVERVAQFDVISLGVRGEIVAGSEFQVLVELRNVGQAAGTRTVQVGAEGLGTASTEVQLDPGQSAEEWLTLSTSSGDAGEYTLTARTDDERMNLNVTVLDADERTGNGDGDDGDESDNDTDGADNDSVITQSDDEAPGFGIGAALAGLGGAGYLLKRRLDDGTDDQE